MLLASIAFMETNEDARMKGSRICRSVANSTRIKPLNGGLSSSCSRIITVTDSHAVSSYILGCLARRKS